jgi:hypothetical protein
MRILRIPQSYIAAGINRRRWMPAMPANKPF